MKLSQSNHKVKPFKNHGFHHFDAMYELMPHGAQGTNVFHPTGQTHGVVSSHIPPTSDNIPPGPTSDGLQSDDDDHPPPFTSPAPHPLTINQSVTSVSSGKRKYSALDDDKRSPCSHRFHAKRRRPPAVLL